MKKISAIIISCVFSLSLIFGSMTAFAAYTPYQAQIYGIGYYDELVIRSQPDSNSQREGGLSDGNIVTITQISSNGWGYINQGGCEGWINLQWTKIYGSYTADQPSYGYITPTYYTVYGTGYEGLELRVSPTVNSSTFGPIPNGTTVLVQAIQGDWAYTSYNGNNGWANIAHLAAQTFQATVYDTGTEGLALKAYADVNASRYLYIPNGAAVTIDCVSTNGWGHTNYNGYSGWISLRYTKVSGSYEATVPGYGYITPTFYIVTDTENEGLELRTTASVESSTFGPIPSNTIVLAEAIINDWAYVSYNGHKGWANTKYLAKTTVQSTVYNTDGEGLALKASADGSSQRYCLIPDGTVLNISQVTNGWGYTSYNGQQGWVAVRYTRLNSKLEPVAPTTGFINAKTYTVVNVTDGLEMRTSYDGENLSVCSVPLGTQLTVTAIEHNWGFTSYNGHTGWVLMTYLQ